MANKRPFKFTTQEYTVVLWAVGLFIFIVVFQNGNTQIAPGLIVFPQWVMMFFFVAFFFTFIAFALPCYQISKYNLNMFMDRMEQGFEGWLRFTKNRKFAPQIIQTGPLGQEKGLVSGHKADIINRGDFPVTLLNGNHAVIKYDLMSHNVNLNEALGWKLTVHKYGFLGQSAYKKCLEDGRTMKKIKKERKIILEKKL
jgi:hypothetical protein